MERPATRTLYELQLLPQYPGQKSVLGLINKTRTYGGRDTLELLLTSPCVSRTAIEERQTLFQFVARHLDQLTIDVSHAYVLAAENHLISNLAWSSAENRLKQYQRALWFSWFHPHDFNRLRGGIAAVQIVLRAIEQKTAWLTKTPQLPAQLQPYSDTLRTFFNRPDIRKALQLSDRSAAVIHADFILRHQNKEAVRALFDVFYQLDAYCAIARFTKTAAWTYPRFIDSDRPVFQVEAMAHPLLDADTTIRSDFSLTEPCTLTLLTGGNMSGKTTFLKACGIVVYLAHLGLAVPAKAVQISFFDVLFTSIHLSDNLELGHSHFYSELMEIQAVADAITGEQRVFMIADELFRGTNPQDALVCSRRIIDALIRQNGSLFMISSHLPEISTTYQTNDQVQFNCFKTQVIDGKLVCHHTIDSGIAKEQTGVLLLEQSGVLNGLK